MNALFCSISIWTSPRSRSERIIQPLPESHTVSDCKSLSYGPLSTLKLHQPFKYANLGLLPVSMGLAWPKSQCSTPSAKCLRIALQEESMVWFRKISPGIWTDISSIQCAEAMQIQSTPWNHEAKHWSSARVSQCFHQKVLRQ